MSATSGFAADLILPTTPSTPLPIYEAAGFDWDGFYVGAFGGGQFAGNTNGLVGVLAGVNVTVADPIVLGVEASADYAWNDGFNASEIFLAGRAGVALDSVLVYAKAGVGYRDANNDGSANGATYGFGGGVELAVSEAVSVRGEVLGQGFFGDDAPNNGEPSAAKATLGVSYHF